MDSMKNLSMNGRLVISVIHQPRSSIYDMFDRLCLLSMGRTIYLGPAADALNFFNAGGHYCPQSFNPSDFYLDVLSPDSRTPELEVAANARILALANQVCTDPDHAPLPSPPLPSRPVLTSVLYRFVGGLASGTDGAPR